MLTVAEALARAARHVDSGRRVILGIAGPPGAGKSTLAETIRLRLGERVRVFAMDGFHLAQSELVRLGRTERKGAPDTFDAAGYLAMLRRLRNPSEDVVYAPEFRRSIEDPIAGAVPIPAEVPLVITEGNYLLLEQPPWDAVRDLLDEAWFVSVPDRLRVERLVARHVAFGRDPDAAAAWVRSADQPNAELIESVRHRADAIVAIE